MGIGAGMARLVRKQGGRLLLAAALPALASCGLFRQANPAPASINADWRQVATEADRRRLRDWRGAWDAGLAAARATDPVAVTAQGALFVPDDALGGAMPPPGAYRCRTFKLGSQVNGPGFSAFPWAECIIRDEGDVRRFEQRTGTQRPTGLLIADTDGRARFFGAMMLADETTALRYGVDATRDMAGYVERIGPSRWRLVFPYPRFESLIDVIDLVPATAPATPSGQPAQ